MTSDKQRKMRARDLAAREQISYTAALRRLDTLPTLRPRTEMPVLRTAFTPAVNWDHLEQPEFDRIVEALVHRLYDAPDTQVVAYDGRGGDQGRDVVVIQGGRIRIFQLKYFRDGFGQERRTQRRQITASFNRALQHNPAEWVLVIPTNPTPGEEQFVLDHGAEHPKLKIRIMGRQELDSRLSAFPDLVGFLLRDSLREAATIYQQERATLQDGLADLTQRHVDLQAITDTLDPDWTVDTARVNGITEHRLRAKHHHAAEVSPIELTISGTFGPEHLDLAKQVRRSLGFGTGEPFTLPAAVVERLTFTGPKWLTPLEGRAEVSWIPITRMPDESAVAEFTIIDRNEQRVSTHQAKVVHGGSGPLGHSLTAEFYDLLRLKMLVATDGVSTLEGTFVSDSGQPAAILQAISLYRDLEKCQTLELRLDGNLIGKYTCTRPWTMSDDINKSMQLAEQLADDFAVLQRHCRVYFAIPTRVTAHERIRIRVARLLVDGHCVIDPDARSFTATLNGGYGPEMQAALSNDQPSTFRLDSDLTVNLAGHDLEIGRVSYFHTRTQIIDRLKLIRALERGKGDGQKLKLIPLDGQRFRAFMPSARPGRDDEPLHPTPWGLPGLDGPAEG